MYGTYETYEGKPAVRFERVYPHPVERVWRSITVPEEMASWFPSTVEVDLREGGAMRFTFDPQPRRADGRPGRRARPAEGLRVPVGQGPAAARARARGRRHPPDAHPDARGGRGRAQRRGLARLPRQARRRGHRLGAPLRGVPAPRCPRRSRDPGRASPGSPAPRGRCRRRGRGTPSRWSAAAPGRSARAAPSSRPRSSRAAGSCRRSSRSPSTRAARS